MKKPKLKLNFNWDSATDKLLKSTDKLLSLLERERKPSAEKKEKQEEKSS